MATLPAQIGTTTLIARLEQMILGAEPGLATPGTWRAYIEPVEAFQVSLPPSNIALAPRIVFGPGSPVSFAFDSTTGELLRAPGIPGVEVPVVLWSPGTDANGNPTQVPATGQDWVLTLVQEDEGLAPRVWGSWLFSLSYQDAGQTRDLALIGVPGPSPAQSPEFVKQVKSALAAYFASHPAGPAGPQGEQGPRGLTGPQGIQGPAGPGNSNADVAGYVQNQGPTRNALTDVILSVIEPPLNPTRFGADPTGVAPSRAGVQQAIDVASAAGGGAVLIDGTFRIDSNLLPRDNVMLIGRGWGKSILKPPSTWNNGNGGSVLEVGGSVGNPIDNFFVRDIKFDLSDVPTAVQAKALFVTFMKNLRFENNWVLNSTATGIGADFLDGGVIRGNLVEGCGRAAQGSESSMLGCSGIGIGTGAWATEATLVEGNFVRNPVRYGIFLEYQRGISTEFARYLKVLNNHIEGAHWGIGSDGVGWANIEGNTIERSDMDGLSLTVGNAGALSFGDLIAFNRITGSGRYGIRLDATQGGVPNLPRTGHWRVIGNDIWGNAGVGIKFESSAVIPHVKINDNSVFENGSIGIDITGGGLSESEILRNRIVDNNGRGIRLLANALTRVKIAGNRSGDTRSTGRTQTHGIDIADLSKLDQVDIADNDFRNATVAAIGSSGTLDPAKANTMVRNKGVGPDVVDAVTVSASPMTYPVGPRPEKLWVIGGAWTSIQINGQTVLTGPGSLDVEPNDVVTFTYTTAPTAIKRRKI